MQGCRNLTVYRAAVAFVGPVEPRPNLGRGLETMLKCPNCGCRNSDEAAECRKCASLLLEQAGTVYESSVQSVGPGWAELLRSYALTSFVVGLVVKGYWGGYGSWPVMDFEPWATIRTWLGPVLLYGGASGYVLRWFSPGHSLALLTSSGKGSDASSDTG